eukprot:GSChrysophyteH1.ASY1.ANO1.866.1 assembled CDS
MSPTTISQAILHGELHLQVCIPKTQTLSDGESKYTSFGVEVTSPFGRWTVHRRYRQFYSLNAALMKDAPRGMIPALPKKKTIGLLQQAFVEERREALETYLQKLLLMPQFLSYQAIIEFLDNDLGGTLSMQLQMVRMKNQLAEYESSTAQLQDQLTKANKEKAQSTALVQLLSKRVQALEKENGSELGPDFQFSDTGLDLGASMEKKERGSSSTAEGLDYFASGSPSSPMPGYFLKQVLGLGDDENSTTTSSSGEGSFLASNHAWPSLGKGECPSPEVRRPRPVAATIIPASALDFTAELTMMDRLADEVVTMVQPQESQIQYRLSASRFLSKYTRKILGAQVFEIGVQGMHCFLPDDPIRLSVFHSPSTEPGWHIRLNEHLCRLSGGSIVSEDAETVTTRKHQLSNVSFVSSSETTHKLQCVVDSVLGVEMLPNMRLDMCLMAFFEDFDRMFGKDNMFKRSLILVRAWWIYEANMSSVFGISDSAFCVMVMSVMNRCASKIHCPFHTLCHFLAEFSTFDFAENVITIEGPQPVDDYLSTPSRGSSEGLVNVEYLHRYRKLALAIDEDESSTMDLLNEKIGDGGMSDASFVSSRIKSGSYAPTACAFTRKPIMIAHPLLPGMIFDGQALQLRKKSNRIINEIVAGARAILPMLTSLGEHSEHEHTEKFFKNITLRFGRGWRPDVPSSLLTAHPSNTSMGSLLEQRTRLSGSSQDFGRANDGELTQNVFWISLDRLWERIRYCNLLLESQISESGLRILSRQVLEDKEPLPVGEIGKMLQEACPGITNMSSVLKECFGGLKKFLESYPEDFVLAMDHPFNPNVYLRDSLTAEELSLVQRGEPIVRSSHQNWPVKSSKKPVRGHNSSGRGPNRKKTASPAISQQSSEMAFRTFSSDSGGIVGTRRTAYPLAGQLASHGSLTPQFNSHSINMSPESSQLPRRSYSGAGEIMGMGDVRGRALTTGTVPSLSDTISGAGLLSGEGHLDLRGRAVSGSGLPLADTSQLYSNSMLGRMGMPDPHAPEFVPTGIVPPSNSGASSISSGMQNNFN